MSGPGHAPKHIDVKRDRGVTILWPDGRTSYYSVRYLRKWSPSAEARHMREEIAKNPLTVLPASAQSGEKPLTIANAEFVGHYAIKFSFSDGHDTGIYSWEYLREIDPQMIEARKAARGGGDGKAGSSRGPKRPRGADADGVDPDGAAWRREVEEEGEGGTKS
ncbi:MAG: gamma-butyrobetaine hydroxylase-like domain-containing protein [Phycisphaerales bacterium]